MALWSNIDETAGKPKNLSSAEKSATVGIASNEAAANGLTAGWNLKTTGSGGRSGRVFHEVLVAMGSITGDNDTVDPDPVITINTQPSVISVTSPSPATYSVGASVTLGATLSYQWQVSPNGSAWADISGETNATLTVVDTDAEYVTGNQFRVVVSTVGAVSVTSNATTLTIS